MAELNFDANDVDPGSDFKPLPAGKYPVVITASERKDTKKKDGWYLKLALVVLDGKYKERKLWDQLNLDNPSADAVEIAEKTLSSICRAVGVMQPKDSTELHNKPLVAYVKIEPASKEFAAGNIIKAYGPTDGQQSYQAPQALPAEAPLPDDEPMTGPDGEPIPF